MTDVIRKGVFKLAIPALLVVAFGTPAGAGHGGGKRGPDLSNCPNLKVPAGNKLASHAYAEGVQVYRWSGTSWVFVAPEALLYANERSDEVIGIHYAGPTWENECGAVVGQVLERSTQDADSIPWLLLKAVDTDGRGVFARVTYILRVNTEGGLAPAVAGTFVGQEARVPYTADYYFYRAHR